MSQTNQVCPKQLKYGKGIREARESKGMTIANLAYKTGYSTETISRMEHGYNVKAITMIDVLSALGYELAIKEKS